MARFAEAPDTSEYLNNLRRSPRSGLGNTFSVWLTLKSLEKFLAVNGFPNVAVIQSDHNNLRYRLVAYREQNVTKTQPLPKISSFEESIQKAKEMDLVFLKTNPGKIAVVGVNPYLNSIAEYLFDAGISALYVVNLDKTQENHEISSIPKVSVSDYIDQKPQFSVLATPEFAKTYQTLMLHDFSKYIFTSFIQSQISKMKR